MMVSKIVLHEVHWKMVFDGDSHPHFGQINDFKIPIKLPSLTYGNFYLPHRALLADISRDLDEILIEISKVNRHHGADRPGSFDWPFLYADPGALQM